MVEPKTIREVSVVVEELRDSLEKRLDLFSKLLIAGIALLGAMVVGSGAVYFQLGTAFTQISEIKESLKELKAEVKSLSGIARAFDKNQQTIIAGLEARREMPPEQAPTPPSNGPYLLDLLAAVSGEALTIRDLIKVPPQTNDPGTFLVGQGVDGLGVKPTLLPDQVILKFPALKGVTYAVDKNNAVALFDPITNRIFAII